MFKGILLDFDGTLVNSLPTFLEAYGSTLKKYGFRLKKQEIIEKCFGKTTEEICKTIGIPGMIDEFDGTYISNLKGLTSSIRLFPGVKGVLEYMASRGTKIGLATFSYRWYTEDVTRLLGINSYFGSVICFGDAQKPKPDPGVVITSCKNLGIELNDILVLGDSKSDIIMGKAASCKTALFLPAENRAFYDFDDLKRMTPDFILNEFSELKAFV
jgi:pyrophosphatase PpaX